MKRIFILVLFVIFGQVSFGQVYQLMPQYGYQALRMSFDSTLQIPTVCGVPTLKSVYNTRRGAIAFDSCNNRFYTYNPKTFTWSYLGGGGGSQNLQQVTDIGAITTNTIEINKSSISLLKLNEELSLGNYNILNWYLVDPTIAQFKIYSDNTSVYETPSIYSNGNTGNFTITAGTTANSEVPKLNFNATGDFINMNDINSNSIKINPSYSKFSTNFNNTYLYFNKDLSGQENKTYYFPNHNFGSSIDDTINITTNVNGNFADANGTISFDLIDSLKRSTDSVFAKRNGSWVFQYKDSVSNTSGFVPYTGATQDVDLGTNKLSAHSFYITGTNGNGHIHLKHQASDATATGQSTSLYADNNGDIKWKNDGNYYTTLKTSGNTADRVYTYPNATTTIIGASDTATMLTNYAKNSSVALKVNISDTANMLTNYAKISAVNLKVNISDTASMLSKYMRKTDTASLSTRIDARVKYTDTSAMLTNYAKTSAVNLKVNISDTSSMLTNYAKTSTVNTKLAISDTTAFDRKSVAAFTFRANNTASTANVTDQVFRDSSTLTYNGTITWTGTTAPSGATSHRYRWFQIGKMVTITFTINYATAGSALSAVKLTLPAGCPNPTNFGTLTGANDVLGSAWGFLGTATSTVTTGRVLLQNNATNNGYEFNIAAASANYKVGGFTLTYFTD